MINKFDREIINTMREKMQDVLQKIAGELGLDITIGGYRFDSLKATTKVTLKIRDNGEGKSADELEWNKWANMIGLKKEWFGKKFMYKGMRFTVIGLKRSRRKYPVLAEELMDGRKLCFPIETIKECFGERK